MSDKKISKAQAEKLAPEPLKRYAYDNVKNIDDLFTGDSYAGVREALKETGVARYNDITIAAHLDEDDNVLAMAAAISREPVRSEKFLRDEVPDLNIKGSLSRQQKLELYHQIANKEGIINNAIKKKASLISQEGHFMVRSARQGKRPRKAVIDDLLTLLTFWQDNVNSADAESAITGSRGLRQVIRRGSRQAIIEGDLFLRQQWTSIKIPQLNNKRFKLPMLLQALPSSEVEVSEDIVGLGVDVFFWKPSSSKIQKLLKPRDKEVKDVIDKVIDKEILNELLKRRKAFLDPALLIHIKHAGVDTDAYGQSDVEAALTDVAYSRALKSLDFVTIDSLINRMLVIKIGDENPDSDFHNLAVAQHRVNVFRNLIREVGPNMLVVWAGHDIDKVDIGAHNQILDTDERHKLAKDLIKLAAGVPDPLLTGSAEGGKAVAWAGFIALASVAAELQEEFAQSFTQLGKRIATENRFDDVDVIYEFSHRLLADKEANAKIMLSAFDRGALSYRTLLEEVGKDFDVEKERKGDELEKGDVELFKPPEIPRGGPSGNVGTDPSDQPGRPDKTSKPKLGPDRDREDKSLDS